MARLFISYRRKDSSGYAQTLHEDLLQAFPEMDVFRDLESIAAGEDFVDAIERELDRCNVVLVLIGPHWLSMPDSQGRRRLDNPLDHVRTEIARALKRKGVRVIPVLVGGAVMPDPEQLPDELQVLGRRNAHEMTDKRWQYDFGELCGVLESLPGMPKRVVTTDGTAQRDTTAADDLPLPDSLRKPVGRVIGAARKLVWGVGIFFTAILVLAVFIGENETTPDVPPAIDSGDVPITPEPPSPAPVPLAALPAPVVASPEPEPVAPVAPPERDLSGNWTMVDAQGERIPLTLSRQGNDLSLRSPRINVTQHPVWQVYNAVLIQTYGQGVTDIHFEGEGEAMDRDLSFALNIYANGTLMINTGSLNLRVANSRTMNGTLRYSSGETSQVTLSRP
jgi:hypothetical protein